jgi:uncharacterized membrane protein
MALIVLSLFYVFTPMLVLHLCRKYRFVNKLGSVFLAYLIGLVFGNIGLLPAGSEKVQEILTTITIPLAIPMLLFSANIRQWIKLARVAVISLVIGVVSVLIVVTIGFFLFKGKGMPEIWKVSGMLVGVYTGGTPNLAALKMMLNVDANIYILTHTYDMAVSIVYLAFLMTIGQRFFHLFLKRFPLGKHIENKEFDGANPYQGILKKEQFYPILKSFGLAVIIFGLGGGLSLLFDKSLQMVVVILTITSLGIAASLIPSVNRIEKSFDAGMYLILIFSIVVASMADVSKFTDLTPGLFGYITFTVFGALALHSLLAKVFNVDADTMIITSTALICSPPFVPVVAGAIGNRAVIISGLTVGIIGYAVGNYMGLALSEMLKTIP